MKAPFSRLIAALFIAPFVTTGASAAPPELDFPLPARLSAQSDDPISAAHIATGPFANGMVPTIAAEGALSERAWVIPTSNLGTLQLLQPLRDQLAAAGFAPIFACGTEACGGFDFRFGIPVLPEPDMHIDLGDFQYLSASRKTATGTDYAALLVSRSSDTGFVQLVYLDDPATSARPTVSASAPTDTLITSPPPNALTAPLDQGLPMVLENLAFASGSSALEKGDYPALSALAEWLGAHPQTVVTLVGHTDTDGGLAGNITVSRARAASVRSYLIQTLKVPASQVLAEGAGYLAPRASNQTPEGRQKNRRVEVMITSTP